MFFLRRYLNRICIFGKIWELVLNFVILKDVDVRLCAHACISVHACIYVHACTCR